MTGRLGRRAVWARVGGEALRTVVALVLVPRQATFAREGVASGACSGGSASWKPSYWTYSGLRPVRGECVPGIATGRTLPATALACGGDAGGPWRLTE